MSEVNFVNSYAHYTTSAQGNTKIAIAGTPVSGAGAFGGWGVTNTLEQYNFAGSTDEREFSCFFNIDVPGPATPYGKTLFVLFDNSTPQVWADVQPDGSAKVYHGAWLGYGAEIFPGRGALIGTLPAGSIQYGIQSNHKVSVKHHASTGSFRWIIDGVTVLNLTNVRTTGTYGENNVAGHVEGGPGGNFSTNLRINYSNLISGGGAASTVSHMAIADDIGQIPGQPRLGILKPDGAGTHADFTPVSAANWQNVDEATPNEDTDYNESETVGDLDTFTMENVPAGTTSIVAVAVTIRLKKTDANSRMVAAVLRIGGTDYVHPTTKGVPGAYAYLQWVWTLSPATGVAFTVAEVNALESGYKIVS